MECQFCALLLLSPFPKAGGVRPADRVARVSGRPRAPQPPGRPLLYWWLNTEPISIKKKATPRSLYYILRK